MEHERHRIEKLLGAMPSLRPLLDDDIAEAYATVAQRLTAKARLPRAALPLQFPYTREQLFDQQPWLLAAPIDRA